MMPQTLTLSSQSFAMFQNENWQKNDMYRKTLWKQENKEQLLLLMLKTTVIPKLA